MRADSRAARSRSAALEDMPPSLYWIVYRHNGEAEDRARHRESAF
jgi:hypothetical protein